MSNRPTLARTVARFIPAAVILSLAISASTAHAIFDAKFDWKDRNHKLKICLKDANCPANMKDSLQAAIGLWNGKNLTWKLEYVDNCDDAQVVIQCANIGSLGSTSAKWERADNTKATVTIKSNADWGWCDDKHELVSTIAHELGHCCRLDDTPQADQTKCMRGAQGKPGHHRGPSTEDSKEAETSDTTKALGVVSNPSGGTREQNYSGVMMPRPGEAPFDFFRALSFELRAFDPERLIIFGYFPSGPNLQWQAFLNSPGWDMQTTFLVIQYPESTSVRYGVLHVTDRPWSPSFFPHVIAPPDTIVPVDTSQVVLYTTLSTHPAGPADDVMTYKWIVDDTTGYKGGPEFTIRLPVGTHRLRLIGRDQFGSEGFDEMFVTVLSSTSAPDPDLGPNGLRLVFASPVWSGRDLPIHYTVPTAAGVSLRVYDAQGRLVRELDSGERRAGEHRAVWDLRDERGDKVRAGGYFVSLRAGGAMLTRKVFITP